MEEVTLEQLKHIDQYGYWKEIPINTFNYVKIGDTIKRENGDIAIVTDFVLHTGELVINDGEILGTFEDIKRKMNLSHFLVQLIKSSNVRLNDLFNKLSLIDAETNIYKVFVNNINLLEPETIFRFINCYSPDIEAIARYFPKNVENLLFYKVIDHHNVQELEILMSPKRFEDFGIEVSNFIPSFISIHEQPYETNYYDSNGNSLMYFCKSTHKLLTFEESKNLSTTDLIVLNKKNE